MVLVEATGSLRLADVLVSCWHAIQGKDNVLSLTPVRRAAVLVVDGLGAHNLRSHAGHARWLTSAWKNRSLSADSGFPSTTASALTSLTTGQLAGTHGIAGYTLRDPDSHVIVNHLKEWTPAAQPDTWQRSVTVFEIAARVGVPSLALGEQRFDGSDFTAATWRGARFRGVNSLEEQGAELRRFFDQNERALAYLYWPALDRTGHSSGVDSESWTHRLEELDASLQGLSALLQPDEGLIVTADHGMLDVPEEHKLILAETSLLLEGLTAWAGEPRVPHLYFESDSVAHVARERWEEALGDSALVMTRQEVIDGGWLGDVHPEVANRIGDLVIACMNSLVIYRESQASVASLAMIGQHGSLTSVEREVPVIPLGAWA